mmetsp:Transcript_35338/g.112445  ORF Transcript_35338/g.112445 Transcript_35338/m.112445 type:complete len:375 (+) Transcript_35338:115-1239(+)
MASDVVKFSGAIDKVYKTYSTQEVQLDAKELRGLGEREQRATQLVEQKFQQQLQRARAAFLQEFRNHSVVVKCEVQKIREELTEKLEEKYGAQVKLLREQLTEEKSQSQKYKDEIFKLKGLAAAQEAYTTAMRHRLGLDKKEELRAEIQELKQELEGMKKENADISHQLSCRDGLVSQLGAELSGLEDELKKQASGFSEEKRSYEELLRSLRQEMRQQQDHFREHLKEFEEQFEEYRTKTTAELRIQDILNTRRSQALASMEEERQRHVRARAKPTPRIGAAEEGEAEGALQGPGPYELAKDSRYRVDDMGMDTAWRDYQLSDLQLVPPARKPRQPKFKVDRMRKSLGAQAPVATDTPRQVPLTTAVLGLPRLA